MEKTNLGSSTQLFLVQPQWCRDKLDMSRVRDFDKLTPRIQKIVLFDPKEVYERLNDYGWINPFRRYNSVPMSIIFPKTENNTCRCGCGVKLSGRRTSWASDVCQDGSVAIQQIICGHSVLNFYCGKIFSRDCGVCGQTEIQTHSTHELDHLHPVKFGGAMGWLSNYQFKCKVCHRKKTNNDFGWCKVAKPDIPIQRTIFDNDIQK